MKYNSQIKLKTENKKKQRIPNNNRKMLQLENIKLNQQNNTRLTKNHHQKPLITTWKFKKQHQLKRSTTPPQQQKQSELTILETQIVPETQTQETTQFSFLSPSMVTKNRQQIPNSTPETIDVRTPENNKPNTKETASTPTPQHEQHQRARTFATRLYRMNFVDIGSFVNVILEEKENLTALAMYYTLGDYDPLNKFIKTFRNKDTINTHKIITEAKTTKTNTLSRIYQHLNAINNRVEKRKLAKNKHKNTLKVILNNTT